MHRSAADQFFRPDNIARYCVEYGEHAFHRRLCDDFSRIERENDRRRSDVQVAIVVGVEARQPFWRARQWIDREHAVIGVADTDERDTTRINRRRRPQTISWLAACTHARRPSRLPRGGIESKKATRDQRAVAIG